MNQAAFTIFCDIDGTILPQGEGALSEVRPRNALPHVVEKLTDWKQAGACIILTTARPAQLRLFTYRELNRLKIPYDQLLMDVGTGPRVLINNLPTYEFMPNPAPTALAFNVRMNEGLGSITLPFLP